MCIAHCVDSPFRDGMFSIIAVDFRIHFFRTSTQTLPRLVGSHVRKSSLRDKKMCAHTIRLTRNVFVRPTQTRIILYRGEVYVFFFFHPTT